MINATKQQYGFSTNELDQGIFPIRKKLKQQISGKIFRLVFNLKIYKKYINGIKIKEILKEINWIEHLHQDTIISRFC